MGGSNVPGLNRLLLSQNISLGDTVLEGKDTISTISVIEMNAYNLSGDVYIPLSKEKNEVPKLHISSGSSIIRVPLNSYVWLTDTLYDQGNHILQENFRIKNTSVTK
jgi:hypothetical protein